LLRGAIPNTNPDWGVNRLRKELIGLGYKYEEQRVILGSFCAIATLAKNSG
jgi:hypothetical protein